MIKQNILNLSLLLLISLFNTTQAQNKKRCATTEALQKLYQAHPEMYRSFVDNENRYDNMLKLARTTNVVDTEVYIIPVVFHVLHENGPENISDAQIIDAINIMNRDMRKLNADTADVIPPFKHLVSDIRIEFRLAQIDPQGNCTNGIDRIYTSLTNYGNDSAKINPWPRENYLNVWTVKMLEQTDWAAYAYYPSAATGSMSARDGILTLHNYVGSIGTSRPLTSRTMTHEVGHWLDLGHPWNRTINISINVGLACGDDLIDDTPITKGHTSCPNLYEPGCRVDDFSEGCFKFSNVAAANSGTVDVTPIDTLFNELNITPFVANGLSPNANRDSVFSFTGWDTGANDRETVYNNLTGTINTSKYYEVTIAPKLPYTMSLTGLKFSVNRSETGPRTFAVRSSADGFSSNLTTTVSPSNLKLIANPTNEIFYNTDTTLSEYGSNILLSGNAFTNKITPITFRIYAWNAEDALGSFGIDSLSFIGTAATIENIQNYMEYSDCENMFTIGQKDRMRLAIKSAISGRSNLWSPANLLATGVFTPTTCVPIPDFYVKRNRICKGNSITFTKNILNGTETNRVWTFQGGTPATSTLANPTITYNTPGTFSVTLVATNAAGTGTISKTQYIRVDNTTADIDYNGSYTEGFETATLLNYDWQSYDLDNNGHKWQWFENAGTNGTNAAGINSYNSYFPDVDELVSPSFDLTNNPNPALTFKIAAASTSTLINDYKDELKVFYSVDCGNTWVPRATYTGTALANNPPQSTSFSPNNTTNWEVKTVQIPTFFQSSNLRFKFQYKASNVSNNLYLDDINISQAVGLQEQILNNNKFLIYPNPSNDKTEIKYQLNEITNIKIELIDILGKIVFEHNKSSQTIGEHTVVISKQDLHLNNGIYFVRLAAGNQTYTQKLIITN